MIWKKPVDLQSLNEWHQNTMQQHIGIQFTEIGDDYIKATMPVDNRTKQPMGLLHGGASVALAESLGSVASVLCVDPEKQTVVGLEINANHIKKIEVLTHEHYLGPLVLHGAILLSTYNGDLGGFEINTENASINYEGLQLKREFYSPGYETQIARESRVPDQRSVLYWNASQQINAQSNTPIQFYTSDLSGEFEVVVEGISKDGVAGSAVYRFVVEENN